jgi:hypothetical protein
MMATTLASRNPLNLLGRSPYIAGPPPVDFTGVHLEFQSLQTATDLLMSVIKAVQTASIMASYTLATLPSASTVGSTAYVTNATGGACPVYADGTSWRRFTNGAVVS